VTQAPAARYCYQEGIANLCSLGCRMRISIGEMVERCMQEQEVRQQEQDIQDQKQQEQEARNNIRATRALYSCLFFIPFGFIGSWLAISSSVAQLNTWLIASVVIASWVRIQFNNFMKTSTSILAFCLGNGMGIAFGIPHNNIGNALALGFGLSSVFIFFMGFVLIAIQIFQMSNRQQAGRGNEGQPLIPD
jgi:hypothetical protein